MRRWNGWGDEGILYPFPDSAASFLSKLIGEGIHETDASYEQVLKTVPPSRLPADSRVDTGAVERLRHARGQSLPDWVALRSGRIGTFPDGIAFPGSNEEVSALLDYAQQAEAHVIPFGGGTSVVGHINPLPSEAPILTIDLSRLNQLIAIDETSHLATFGAGVNGPNLEKQLHPFGYTLGHFPQSFELSTLGGWIATRSSGQQSYYYGRIENLFAGGHVETPLGALDLPPLPASAAGPDLCELILGSEGRLGIITQAIVRVRPLPEKEAFYGAFFSHWEAGVTAVRQIVQQRTAISMARLSNPMETETTLRLSGKDSLVKWADRGLRLLRYGTERCLLIFGVTGDAKTTSMALRQVKEVLRNHQGLFTGETIGKIWQKSRFLTPYLRNTLWERGYAVDTLETAVPWSKVIPTADAVLRTISEGLEPMNERTLAFAHLSHVYTDGASIYVTFIFRRSKDPDETLEHWQTLKQAASQAIVSNGGTISHQHGVGVDHAPYLPREKGQLGIHLLRAMSQTLDPRGMMNPGKLFSDTPPYA